MTQIRVRHDRTVNHEVPKSRVKVKEEEKKKRFSTFIIVMFKTVTSIM